MRDGFLKDRTAIGASEVAAVLGMSQYASAVDVYDRLVLLLDHGLLPPEEGDNGHIARGIALEPIIADIYTETTGRKVLVATEADVYPDRPWLRSNPDRIIPEQGGDPEGVLECKAPSAPVFRRIKEAGLPPGWIVQGQAQLAARPSAHFVDYCIHCAETWESLIIRIERDDDFIDAVIWPHTERFWKQHVEPRVRPTNYVVEPIPWDNQTEDMSANNRLLFAAADYRSAMEMEKQASEAKAEAKAIIKEELGDVQVAVAGNYKISHKWVAPKKGRLNAKLVAAYVARTGGSMDEVMDQPSAYTRLVVNPL